MPGVLVLNGGDEFRPGNEAQDRELIARARQGPALVVPTAAARQSPEMAVATARRWFSALGVEVEALPLYTRRDAAVPELAARAAFGERFSAFASKSQRALVRETFR